MKRFDQTFVAMRAPVDQLHAKGIRFVSHYFADSVHTNAQNL